MESASLFISEGICKKLEEALIRIGTAIKEMVEEIESAVLKFVKTIENIGQSTEVKGKRLKPFAKKEKALERNIITRVKTYEEVKARALLRKYKPP